jgi:hypothetical protein
MKNQIEVKQPTALGRASSQRLSAMMGGSDDRWGGRTARVGKNTGKRFDQTTNNKVQRCIAQCTRFLLRVSTEQSRGSRSSNF